MKTIRPSRLSIRWLAIIVLAFSSTACDRDAETSLYGFSVFAGAGGGFTNAAASGSFSPFGNYLSGLYSQRDFNTNIAFDFVRAVADNNPDNLALNERLLNVAVSAGQRSIAEQTAEKLASTTDTKNWLANWVLAIKAFRQQHYDKAEELWSRDPNAPFAVLAQPLFKAWVRVAKGDPIGDISPSLRDGEIVQQFWEQFYNFHRPRLLIAQGDNARAAKLYQTIIAAEPNNTSQLLALLYGDILERSGDRTAAQDFYRSVQSQQRNSLLPLRSRLHKLNNQNITPPTALRPEAELATIFYDLSLFLEQQNQIAMASLFLNLGLFLDPNHDPSLSLLGDLHLKEGHPQAAMSLFERLNENSDFYGLTTLQRAAALDSLGNKDDASELLENLATTHPLYRVEAYAALAEQQSQEKLYQQAQESFNRSIQAIDHSLPWHWQLYYGRGISHHQLDQWQQAEDDFLHALKLSPDQPYVLNYLGYSWLERKENYQRAFEMIERAAAILPNSGYIVDSLGWGHYRIGNYDQAVIHLENAATLQPRETEIIDHLGDAYWQVGRHLEARYQWKRAIELFGKNRDDSSAEKQQAIRDKLRFGLDTKSPLSNDPPI